MARRQIYVRLVIRVAPDVVADGRVHILARGVQVFPVAFYLIGEGGFRDPDADIILLATLLCRRRRRLGGEGAHIAEDLLPDVTMRGLSAFAQFKDLLVRDVNAR